MRTFQRLLFLGLLTLPLSAAGGTITAIPPGELNSYYRAVLLAAAQAGPATCDDGTREKRFPREVLDLAAFISELGSPLSGTIDRSGDQPALTFIGLETVHQFVNRLELEVTTSRDFRSIQGLELEITQEKDTNWGTLLVPYLNLDWVPIQKIVCSSRR